MSAACLRSHALCFCRHTSRFLVIWLTFMPFTLWYVVEPLIFMHDTWSIMQFCTKRHLSRKLSLLTLPSAPFTRHAYGWGSIPASLVIAYLLLGIEEIGVQIEEP